MKDGFVVAIDVLTDTDSDLPDRKLCELVVPISELQKVLERVEKEIGNSGG